MLVTFVAVLFNASFRIFKIRHAYKFTFFYPSCFFYFHDWYFVFLKQHTECFNSMSAILRIIYTCLYCKMGKANIFFSVHHYWL